MLMTVAVAGALLLISLAVLCGALDSRSQQSAWRRIAAARRDLHECRDALDQRAIGLDVRQEALDGRERRLTIRERGLLGREQERARGTDAA